MSHNAMARHLASSQLRRARERVPSVLSTAPTHSLLVIITSCAFWPRLSIVSNLTNTIAISYGVFYVLICAKSTNE
ncbi:hypothetical protein LMH87_005716 [Akanthomyces muscarius]|uniref:Uncharacterized protein n=1 Tax=Akanthomyces muscarius TaxID=2231603 RepID=A0A9W8QLX2_AKAMU|nr:hypothetical protein LMH87_005716 [Akanthomyces muscarius]KAJ4164024.1 hypothetical protein LMH87_005716 [Akanthomyces muscarius]